LTYNTDSIFDGYADISPDGQWVTFQSNRDGNHEIYIMTSNGSDVRRLTYDPGRDAVPVFSPDGEWIAFESDRSGSYDIWAMRTDGGELFNVTNASSRDQVAEFSPDGQWLAFQSTRDGDYDIYRIPWPRAVHSSTVTEISWPVSPAGTEACHLTAGDNVTVGDNARLWSVPNVFEGTAKSAIEPEVQIVVHADEPVWGPIRRDSDIDGWWWRVSVPGGELGWIWQGRIIECAEETE
jgi:dipeptidyl aminopeptidase/acylaminoacyl peptidase